MPTILNPNQQDQDKNQQNQSGGMNLAGSGGESAGSGQPGRTAQFSSGASPAQKGSGRYTNLQKYLGANQGATDRLYQGIGNRINQDIGKTEKQASTQASAVREGIQSSEQGLQKGTGYLNQLQDKDFNAQQFAQDQNNLQDFTKFRTGQGIDEAALQNQNLAAQQGYMTAQQQAQQRMGQVGTDQGRFGLLKETFGGREAYKPTYSSGQQRLDQLFLQSGAGNKIGQLQQDLKSKQNILGQNLSGLQGDITNQISDIAKRESELSQNIQNQANTLESGYISDLEKQTQEINAQRQAEMGRYRQFIDRLKNPGTHQTQGTAGLDLGRGPMSQTQMPTMRDSIDPELLKEFGLSSGQRTYNALNDPNLTAEQLVEFGRTANDYRDIASQQNVDYYNALSQLAGVNNSKLSQVGSLVDPTTGQLVKAAKVKTGEGSLQDRLKRAEQQFQEEAAKAMMTGRGSADWSWRRGEFLGRDIDKRTGTENLSAYQTVADYLSGAKGPGMNTATGSYNTDMSNLLIPGGILSALDPSDPTRGARSAARDRATEAAQADLKAQLEAYLKNKGYYNTIG